MNNLSSQGSPTSSSDATWAYMQDDPSGRFGIGDLASWKPSATGGTTTTISFQGKSYKEHTFTTSSQLVVTRPGFAAIYLIGGGGGTGNFSDNYGGGGGGFTRGWFGVYLPVGSHDVEVGAGGAVNSNGGASRLLGFEALGGLTPPSTRGGDGGSGGGGGAGGSYTVGAGGGSDGNNGGTGFAIDVGGTGQVDSTRAFFFSKETLFAGGGGGGGREFGGAGGGAGGGGNGGGGGTPCTNGTNGLGGGAGGGGRNGNTRLAGCVGGSGRVIVRYLE